MNRRVAGLALAALCSTGCVTPKVTAPKELPLKRVAIYRNGVGYFERSGKVRADRLSFKVRPEHIGDFLASLAVMEKGGSSIRAASFPLRTQAPAPIPAPGVDAPPAPPETGLETVSVELDGEEHDLAIGYVTEQPVWKPSYRIVLGKEGPTLQAWGVIQNLSGEDWNDVSLSLIAGAPIAFEATLQTPVTPRRPVVSDAGEFIAAVPRSESTLAQRPPPPPPPMAAPPSAPGYGYGAQRPSKKSGGGGGRAEAGAPMAQPAPEYEQEAPSYSMADAAPRNLSLLASQAVEGGATRYDLPHPVSVPKDSATMVLLLAQPVKGESVYMFAPEGGVPDSSRFPFRVVRFTNTTNGLLERGPIAVYEASSFLGQGVIEPLSEGGEATVPFALDRGLAVDRQGLPTPDAGAVLSKIENGNFWIERESVTRTRYQVRNGKAEDVRVVMRHPRVAGSRLYQPPEGTDDQLGKNVALVPVKVGARGTGEVVVDERTTYTTGVNPLSPEADAAVRAYLADPRADAKVSGPLKRAWELRDRIVKAGQERQKLTSEQESLTSASEQVRESLRSIARNRGEVDGLRKQLADRLADFDNRLAKVTQRIVELDLQLNEDRVRFEETLRDVKLSSALKAS